MTTMDLYYQAGIIILTAVLYVGPYFLGNVDLE